MNARDERLVGLEHWLLHAVAESLRHPPLAIEAGGGLGRELLQLAVARVRPEAGESVLALILDYAGPSDLIASWSVRQFRVHVRLAPGGNNTSRLESATLEAGLTELVVATLPWEPERRWSTPGLIVHSPMRSKHLRTELELRGQAALEADLQQLRASWLADPRPSDSRQVREDPS